VGARLTADRWSDGHPTFDPALSVRAHRRGPPVRPVSLGVLHRDRPVGSLTWTVQDQAAADSMRDD